MEKFCTTLKVTALCFFSVMFCTTTAVADSGNTFEASLPESGEDTVINPCANVTIQDLAGKIPRFKADGVKFYFDPNKMKYDADKDIWWEEQKGSTWTCQLNANVEGTVGDPTELVHNFSWTRSRGSRYGDGESMAAFGDGFMDGLGRKECFTCGLVRWKKGCFPPGVKVSTEDGFKLVEDVAAGDFLWNPVQKRNVKVLNVIEGFEAKPLIEISAGGFALKVSDEHPIFTEAGFKQAKKVSIGDVLYDADGNAHGVDNIRALPVAEGQTVINFTLEGNGEENDRLILADGLVVGDFVAQRVLADNK